ncbi:hypothetical protein HDA36_004183 [Nocardiopsis composta]|uniref:Uncharacterized protein n=1 Tax=Nocardiopsis composta TaxID=157465 RepID=A0A7W8QQ22_9ACTN|nr:hypothetical protein [Nocardiopsis composta]
MASRTRRMGGTAFPFLSFDIPARADGMELIEDDAE